MLRLERGKNHVGKNHVETVDSVVSESQFLCVWFHVLDMPECTMNRGGHWGLRYCGIGQLWYFGNFNLQMWYNCGILQTYRMQFFSMY